VKNRASKAIVWLVKSWFQKSLMRARNGSGVFPSRSMTKTILVGHSRVASWEVARRRSCWTGTSDWARPEDSPSFISAWG